MTHGGGGFLKANRVHRDKLRGLVEGYTLAVTYEVVSDVRGLIVGDVGTRPAVGTMKDV